MFLQGQPPGSAANFPTLLAAGGLGGALTWFIIFPLDVVRARLFQETNILKPKYSSGLAVYRELRATAGWGWAYRGLSATILRALPVGALQMSLNETVGAWLHASDVL